MMRKMFATLLVVMTGFGLQPVSAQSGLNNNSDWKVPVPAPTLPQGGASNIVITAATVIPTLPAFPAINGLPSGFLAPLVGLNTTGLIPPPPGIPRFPTIPTSANIAVFGFDVPVISLPELTFLPPIPPIPPTPILRLIGPTATSEKEISSEKEK